MRDSDYLSSSRTTAKWPLVVFLQVCIRTCHIYDREWNDELCKYILLAYWSNCLIRESEMWTQFSNIYLWVSGLKTWRPSILLAAINFLRDASGFVLGAIFYTNKWLTKTQEVVFKVATVVGVVIFTIYYTYFSVTKICTCDGSTELISPLHANRTTYFPVTNDVEMDRFPQTNTTVHRPPKQAVDAEDPNSSCFADVDKCKDRTYLLRV